MTTYAARRQSVRRGMLIANEAHRMKAESITDIGAHDGTIARRLAMDGFSVLAVDDHERESGGGVLATKLTVNAANLGSLGRADIVVALSVLHHMPDWRGVLEGMRRVARKAVIVEVPHPAEKLKRARARHELPEMHAAVTEIASHVIGSAPAVHDPKLHRDLWVVPPVRSGVVFSGGGNHAKTQRRYGDQFEQTLGYRPYPGSLNIRLDRPPDLGEPLIELRPAPKRRYEMWAARLWDIDGHAMIPDRAHDTSLEMLAPVSLRDELQLRDSDSVDVEIIW